MAFDVKATLKAVQSHLEASGYVPTAFIGDVKSPPQEFSAAVFMSSVTTAVAFLTHPTELHLVTVRIYGPAFAEAENTELELARISSEIVQDFLGDFDLGATIRNVDVAGQHGTPLSIRWGYVDASGTMFRVADISLPLIVDDTAKAFTA